MSPPLNDWIILSIFQFSGEMFQFYDQGADIKLISSLVNRKARIDLVKALKKFNIAKPTLSCGIS